jgi:two-component system chemotaxis sensor kinase CheA
MPPASTPAPASAFVQAPPEPTDAAEPAAADTPESPPENNVIKAAANDKAAEQRRDIRVDLRKLDSLVDLVGELLVAEAMVTRNSELEGLQLPTFEKASHQLHLIIRGLQDVAMSVRMVPIAGVFRKMQRLVHDLARNTGKQIKLELSGEETEVDKIVADLIGDPMVHMLRNSADHGLETAEERIAAGKPPTGNIWLSASQQGNEIVISVRDDGKGLDRDRIFDKAKRQGLIAGDGANLSEQEIYGMIFMPGFSTAAQVTGLSGRGVGMDVVKSNIERLKGRIEIKNNPGQGLEFLIRIPLSLAILDGMLLRVGPCKYMLPITAIREALRPKASQILVRHDGQEFIKLREEVMPIRRLHSLHGIKPDCDFLDKGILVILQLYSGPIALFVDEILYQLQTVVKPVPCGIAVNQGVTGFCILNNGEVALILDLAAFSQTPP